MHSTLRKALLVTTVGICGVVGGPVGASIFALAPHHPLSAVALANDDDDGGDRGGDDHGGRDNGDRDGDGRSGHDRDDDDGDDRSGRDHGRNDDDGHDNDQDDDRQGDDDGDGHGRNHAEDDLNDGDDDRADDTDKNGDDRYEAQLKVSNRSLKGLLNGSLIAVDNLGRVLEVEIEYEHGTRIVSVQPHRSDIRRKPGPIEKVSIRPAN